MKRLTSHFALPSDEKIAERIERKPPPLEDIDCLQVSEAITLLDKRMKLVFIATPQDIRLIREVVGIAAAHARTSYLDLESYMANCYRKDLTERDPMRAHALVGVGGTGKSALIQAIARLLVPETPELEINGLPAFPIEPVWVMTMLSKTLSLSSLLEPMLGPIRKGEGRADLLIPRAAKRAFTNGVCTIFLDESQFISATIEAHASAASLLLQVPYFGPPFFFGGNFSLINKLMNRPNQERDRLLSNLIVLRPEQRGSKAHLDTVTAHLELFGSGTASDKAVRACSHADQIHNYTYGINRKMCILFQHGWRLAREAGSPILTFAHLEKAYSSDAYYTHREEVELLKSGTDQKQLLRKGLACELVSPEPSNVITVPAFSDLLARNTSLALSVSQLSKKNREAYLGLKGNQRTGNSSSPAKVVKIKRGKKTLESLQEAGQSALDEFSPKQ